MDNWDIFRVTSSNGVEDAQLTNAKGCHNGRDAFDPSVAICSVSSVQLVAIAYPAEANLGDVVQSDLGSSGSITVKKQSIEQPKLTRL